MKLCILENDDLDPKVEPTYKGYGAMFERLLRQAGAEGEFDIFNTVRGEYPASFAAYDAVLLTGSKADSFSQEPWVLALKDKVQVLLAVPEALEVLAVLSFGYPTRSLGQGKKQRKPLAEVASQERFGEPFLIVKG